jgi:hypothetical protein
MFSEYKFGPKKAYEQYHFVVLPLPGIAVTSGPAGIGDPEATPAGKAPFVLITS